VRHGSPCPPPSPCLIHQVNTRAAELLYSIVRDWAAADKDELILDVCCGTGTIGLCMSAGTRSSPPSALSQRESERESCSCAGTELDCCGRHVDEDLKIFATLECSVTTRFPPRSLRYARSSCGA
jgi:hypothetical protein